MAMLNNQRVYPNFTGHIAYVTHLQLSVELWSDGPPHPPKMSLVDAVLHMLLKLPLLPLVSW